MSTNLKAISHQVLNSWRLSAARDCSVSVCYTVLVRYILCCEGLSCICREYHMSSVQNNCVCIQEFVTFLLAMDPTHRMSLTTAGSDLTRHWKHIQQIIHGSSRVMGTCTTVQQFPSVPESALAIRRMGSKSWIRCHLSCASRSDWSPCAWPYVALLGLMKLSCSVSIFAIGTLCQVK